MDPREEKLPKWLKDVIREERRCAAVGEEKLAAYQETVEKTRIWYGDYGNKIYVPEPFGYQTIHLNPYGDDDFIHDIQVRIRGEQLEISGGDSLVIQPIVSNVIHVRTER